jgi:hypothetical protein
MSSIEYGNRVRVKDKGIQDYCKEAFGTYEGFVMRVDAWEKSGPLTPENHGTIEIEFNGVREHFSYYKWEEDLEIIND